MADSPRRKAQVERARAARDEGMEVAELAADPRVILAIDKAIADANASGDIWSTNDIRDQFPTCRPGLVGRRVNAAYLRGEMRKLGKEPSSLESTHAKEINRYRGRKRPVPPPRRRHEQRATDGKFATSGGAR